MDHSESSETVAFGNRKDMPTIAIGIVSLGSSIFDDDVHVSISFDIGNWAELRVMSNQVYTETLRQLDF